MAEDLELDSTQSTGEEIANSVSHGIGLLAALAAVPVLIIAAVKWYDVTAIVGASVFGVTMVLLYLTSTLYHALPSSKAKRVLQVLDHAAIFLLIAGTYTPFTFGVLQGAWGWTLFGLVWGFACIGIVLKALGGVRYQALSTCLYLAMGWLILIAIAPLWHNMPGWGLFWLLCGGISYTVGVVFFVAERVPYFHFIWHLFVVIGTACHFIAVMWYAAA
ncbi:MAG: hemolysin III family protein [Deltaproteobacteria bacterium]|nr:hemolysin III family protein [Deltaproteobacteria bacterium]MBW2071873.1 hemolysin III family protein [Deltaproteobacteria bacterium]